MATRSFLLLGLAQIAEHKLVNILLYGRIELVFDLNSIVAALSFNGFKLAGRVHFTQEIKLPTALIILALAHKQIRFHAISWPCL